MIEFIINNKEIVLIIISFLTIIIPLATFLISKNKEQKQINFERFHNKLMKGLANQENKTGLDQQIAIIYELKNYPEYYPVIKRILAYQIDRWGKLLKTTPHIYLLIDEAKETLNFIDKNFISRFLIKRFHYLLTKQ